MKIIGVTLLCISILFDILKYVRQINKLITTKSSTDISSTSWYFAWIKDATAILACLGLQNYAGATLATVGLVMCSITLYLIIIYKPKQWKKDSLIGRNICS